MSWREGRESLDIGNSREAEESLSVLTFVIVDNKSSVNQKDELK